MSAIHYEKAKFEKYPLVICKKVSIGTQLEKQKNFKNAALLENSNFFPIIFWQNQQHQKPFFECSIVEFLKTCARISD